MREDHSEALAAALWVYILIGIAFCGPLLKVVLGSSVGAFLFKIAIGATCVVVTIMLCKDRGIRFTKTSLPGYVLNKRVVTNTVIGPKGNSTQIEFMLNVQVKGRVYNVKVTDKEFNRIQFQTIVTCIPIRKWYGAIKGISTVHFDTT